MKKHKQYVFVVIYGIIGVIVSCTFYFIFFAPLCFDTPDPAWGPLPQIDNINAVSQSRVLQVNINYTLSTYYEHTMQDYVITRGEKVKSSEEVEFIVDVHIEKTEWRGNTTPIVHKYQQTIEKDKIEELNRSIVNLQNALSMRSCFFPHYAPEIRVEITFENGEKTILYSNSGCAQGNPWNIIAKNKLYVQYTGEIPMAVDNILGIGYTGNYLDDFQQGHLVEIPIEGIPQEVTGLGRVLHYARCAENELGLQ